MKCTCLACWECLDAEVAELEREAKRYNEMSGKLYPLLEEIHELQSQGIEQFDEGMKTGKIRFVGGVLQPAEDGAS